MEDNNVYSEIIKSVDILIPHIERNITDWERLASSLSVGGDYLDRAKEMLEVAKKMKLYCIDMLNEMKGR